MTSGGNTKSSVPGAVAPDGGWGWIIVLASFVIHFIMDGITYSMGEVFLQPMMEKLNKLRAPVSTIFAILPAVTLATGPIATILTNTYGCRAVTIAGACLAALGFGISYLFANLWVYYIAIGVIGGIGFGLMYLPAIVSVGFYFERKRSLAIGIAVCGSGLGTLGFPFIMPYIISGPSWFDYDGALLLDAAIIFICIIFGALMVPLPQEPSELRRVERKAKKRARLAANDEQQKRLLSQDLPLREVTAAAVVPERRVSLSDLNKNEVEIYPRKEKALSRSNEHLAEEEPAVIVERKDALLQGSLHQIPLYEQDTAEYHRQVIVTSETQKSAAKKSFVVKIAEQIDLNLLKDAAFALFAASNFLTSLGFNVPYNFANDVAKDANVVEHRRHWILMSIGIANCFGRVVIGFLADRKEVNRLFLYNTTLIIAGLATIAAPFCNHLVATHMTYAAFFGFFSGGYVGLTSIVTVDLVGVDKLSDAFGVLLLFQGVAVAIGTPITGKMRDLLTGRDRPYLWPYLIMGSAIVLSGAILFAIPLIQKRKERRQQPTQHQLDMGMLSYSKQNLSVPEQQQQL